jgi:hypothetical protein
MLFTKMGDDMNVIGQDHKHKQFHLPGSSQVMKTVNDYALDNIPAEKMSMPYRRCRDKVEMIRAEVWLDRYETSSMLPHGLRPYGFQGMLSNFANAAVTHRTLQGRPPRSKELTTAAVGRRG